MFRLGGGGSTFLLEILYRLRNIRLTAVHNIYILLHDWEGNMGKYSVRGWQYWPERSEGQYRSRELNISPYCPTLRNAVIDLLYDLCEHLCHQYDIIMYTSL